MHPAFSAKQRDPCDRSLLFDVFFCLVFSAALVVFILHQHAWDTGGKPVCPKPTEKSTAVPKEKSPLAGFQTLKLWIILAEPVIWQPQDPSGRIHPEPVVKGYWLLRVAAINCIGNIMYNNIYAFFIYGVWSWLRVCSLPAESRLKLFYFLVTTGLMSGKELLIHKFHSWTSQDLLVIYWYNTYTKHILSHCCPLYKLVTILVNIWFSLC